MIPLRSWLDRTPLSSVALTVLREATGRERPLEPLRPTRAAALRSGSRIAFWALNAGVGTSTVAALVAHRSAAAGVAPLLVDLDRWAPSLALRAGLEVATFADALLMAGREREVISRWNEVPFLAGAPSLHSTFDAQRVLETLDRAAAGRAVVMDLGAGPDVLDEVLLERVDVLCVVAGIRASQLQAAFCATTLVPAEVKRVGLVVVGAAEEDAVRIAPRLPWPLLATIPVDPYLAADDFAARVPTLRAIDELIRACA
ncbi:MAG: hypothetical protein HY071_01710 [Chloroflexi bacterium]|nr:hypothetical protein [Chloroflexota bacterium]